MSPRTDANDVHDILRLLLARAADPNQRGINDYTALHMAVAERSALAVQWLLDAGADPDLRTRIDDCETPLEMAESAGLAEIAAILKRRGQPDRQRIKSGLTQLLDIAGTGELVQRQHSYRTRLRMWLNRGEAVRWPALLSDAPDIRLLDDRATMYSTMRINRGSLMSGLFYGVDGMRVGGTRRLEIAPHLAYGEAGIPDRIPPNAVVTAEITILSAGELNT